MIATRNLGIIMDQGANFLLVLLITGAGGNGAGGYVIVEEHYA